MRRQGAIQQSGLRPGRCIFFGFQINEIVKGVDAIVIVYLCYMVIGEIYGYRRYKEEAGCAKPFGLFWIGHFLSIVCCRVFYYLQKNYHYRMAQVFFDQTLFLNAQFWAVTMKCFKLIFYCVFLVFTIIGTVWFVEDGQCLRKLNQSSNNHSKVKMAFWLFLSYSVCFVYVIITIKRRPPQLLAIGGDEIERFRMFVWADQLQREGGRSLTTRELDAMKRSQLVNHSELSRSTSKPITNEMSTLTSTEPVPASDENGTLSCVPDEKQNAVVDPPQRDCTICLAEIDIGDWYKKLPKCEHCFHASCIDKWLSTRATCPVCREEIVIDDGLERGNLPVRSVQREIHIGSGGNQARVVLRFARVNSR